MGLRRNKKLKTWLGSSPSGGIQAPGACGPGLQGAWGLGPFPHKNHPNLSNYDFSQTSWREPGEGVGVG